MEDLLSDKQSYQKGRDLAEIVMLLGWTLIPAFLEQTYRTSEKVSKDLNKSVDECGLAGLLAICAACNDDAWLEGQVSMYDQLADSNLMDCLLLFMLYSRQRHPIFLI